jgi:hypothetical protein
MMLLKWRIFSRLALIIFLLAIGHSIVSWFRSEAEQACTYRWERKVKEAEIKLLAQQERHNVELGKAETQLTQELEAKKAAELKHDTLLEAQTALIPLDEACMQCRINVDRLWMRGDPGEAGDASPTNNKYNVNRGKNGKN